MISLKHNQLKQKYCIHNLTIAKLEHEYDSLDFINSVSPWLFEWRNSSWAMRPLKILRLLEQSA